MLHTRVMRIDIHNHDVDESIMYVLLNGRLDVQEKLLAHIIRLITKQGLAMTAEFDAVKASEDNLFAAVDQMGRVLADVKTKLDALIAGGGADTAALVQLKADIDAKTAEVTSITAANTPAA